MNLVRILTPTIPEDQDRWVCSVADDIHAELPAGFCVWLAATREADFLQGRLTWANWDVEELSQRRDEIVEKDMLNMVLGGWSD